MRKSENTRPYPPDVVDVHTMAYRLCMSSRTVKEYVDRGWLPKPVRIGNMNRWHWPEVVAMVENLKNIRDNGDDDDEYMQGINNVTSIEKTDDRAA